MYGEETTTLLLLHVKSSGQVSGAVEPCGQKAVAAQELLEAGLVQKKPAGQRIDQSSTEEEAAGQKFPMAHVVGLVAPRGQYEPAGQAELKEE